MITSVYSQKHKDYRLIISADNEETAEYVKSYNISPIMISSIVRRDLNHNPYNLYNNRLMDEVKNGWIMFGDDDDYIPNPDTFGKIAGICKDIDTIYIFRMVDLQNGQVIPGFKTFGKAIQFGDIATPNFVFNAKWKDTARWQDKRGGDFMFIRDLINNNSGLLKLNFIDLVTYVVDHRGMHGVKVDI
jgi:hypothetical protein